MNIIVPIKQVPETEIRVKMAADGRSLDLTGVKMVVNPFDEFAIEEALQIKEKLGEGSVTVVTVGDSGSTQALRTALAMGADAAVRVKLEEAPGSDSLAIASMLASIIKDRPCDLVLCGKMAVGSDQSQVPAMLAGLLGWPLVTVVGKLELGDGSFTAQHQIEGMGEVVKASLPAVISAEKGLNEPRYPSLKGIMAAKRAQIEEISPAELGVDAAILGEDGAALELVGIEMPPERGEGITVDAGDDPASAARQLADWLKNHAKVI
ncbi:MAG TPA: electron transfer flavoprotein subunit beta/FixA family protein [Acidobacteriota bacterium]|nr:electron transfer flavoprotein subunit beta/FixA family protein [Acidobacteriota bacterium]